MQKIIDGRVYDTETATALGSAKLPGYMRNADGTLDPASKTGRAGISTLYQTADGTYFLVRRVKGDVVVNADEIREGFVITEPGLYPLSREDALKWAKFWKFSATKIEIMFGPA